MKKHPAQPLTECPKRAQDISQRSSASNASATTPGSAVNNPAANREAARLSAKALPKAESARLICGLPQPVH